MGNQNFFFVPNSWKDEKHLSLIRELQTLPNCLPGSRLVVTMMLAALPEGCFSSVKPWTGNTVITCIVLLRRPATRAEVFFQGWVSLRGIPCTKTLYPIIKRSGTGFQSTRTLVNVTLLLLSPVGLETNTEVHNRISFISENKRFILPSNWI